MTDPDIIPVSSSDDTSLAEIIKNVIVKRLRVTELYIATQTEVIEFGPIKQRKIITKKKKFKKGKKKG